jgi:hypothetical protein
MNLLIILSLFLLCLYQDFGKRFSFIPDFMKVYTAIYKKDGFKGVVKKGGWKILFYFFMFYLIRDTIIYILLPYLVVKGIIF